MLIRLLLNVKRTCTYTYISTHFKRIYTYYMQLRNRTLTRWHVAANRRTLHIRNFCIAYFKHFYCCAISASHAANLRPSPPLPSPPPQLAECAPSLRHKINASDCGGHSGMPPCRQRSQRRCSFVILIKLPLMQFFHLGFIRLILFFALSALTRQALLTFATVYWKEIENTTAMQKFAE